MSSIFNRINIKVLQSEITLQLHKLKEEVNHLGIWLASFCIDLSVRYAARDTIQ